MRRFSDVFLYFMHSLELQPFRSHGISRDCKKEKVRNTAKFDNLYMYSAIEYSSDGNSGPCFSKFLLYFDVPFVVLWDRIGITHWYLILFSLCYTGNFQPNLSI